MLKTRWSYLNPKGLTKWNGHVDYYNNYIIGQWFVLNALAGEELWAHDFFRPNVNFGLAQDVIIASEMRSDGPWTLDFGIYGIHVKTGNILWANHGDGLLGKIASLLDYIPGVTNELRDRPKYIWNKYVLTDRGRIIDVDTGKRALIEKEKIPFLEDKKTISHTFYTEKMLSIDDAKILVNGFDKDFNVIRIDEFGKIAWRFPAEDQIWYVGGNYFSYRLHNNKIYIILGDAPSYLPCSINNPKHVKSSPANYSLGIIEIKSGESEIHQLPKGEQKLTCRIEAIRDNNILINYDGIELFEFELPI